MILLKGGRVIDPRRGMDETLDIVIDGGKIKSIGRLQAVGDYDEILDVTGLVVAPGLIDVHVHFRDPGVTYKEDIKTGAKAAAKGGFTTVVCMANTKPPIDCAEILNYVLEEGKKTDIHVLAAAAVTKGMHGKELVDMADLKAHGAVGFTDDGLPVMESALLEKAMREAAALDVPISLHEEDPSLIRNNGIHQGYVSSRLGISGSSALAEDSMVARDCMIALHTGATVNIQHISSANAVALVKFSKALGANIVAEATPHHFSLDESAVLKYGTLAKMNPPLRTKNDRDAIVEGLKHDVIDLIATDHAPHSKEEKDKPLTEAPSGIIGLETSLALGITNLVRKGHLTMVQLMTKMSLNPAKLYHLNKGWLEEGADADLVIFDEEEEWCVSEFASKSSNSPFAGINLHGKVKYTVCGGKVVYKDGEEKI